MKKYFFTIFFLAILNNLYSQQVEKVFTANWQFRKTGDANWYHAEVPGTVHTDLLANKLIPDPFYRDHEKKVQWVEQENWEYRTKFSADPEIFSRKNIELVFDGLDTYANVYLNDKLILSADNMFRQWRVDVKPFLKKQQNELRIIFLSAVKHDDSLAKLNPLVLAGENNRMYSRKAQYQYGWDWGPRLITCGIWKKIHWEAWDESKTLVRYKSTRQNVQLVTRPDSTGESFYFKVNGKPTFIKGANWIPCESFLPRAKKLFLYKKLIKSAKEANINMLRVWGGGIYEDDEFYDLCDKYNIMVWQDFMFAGALYPADEKFLQNIKEEIRYQVEKLRRHPCIVLWCGNNEIDEAWRNWGWQKQYNYTSADSILLWKNYKKIFHQLIPDILNELDPQRPYWPSSPSLGWGRDSAYKKGDVHYWGVWWGKEPVEKYNEKVGRFNSEYGMQAFPDMKTIRQFALPADMDTSSAAMKAHQKHSFGFSNIKMYIENKFRTPKLFEDLVYVSQLMQADAIKTAIEAHRRNMPATMGTLFWQWNDCWPVVSWSAVDYYGRKKALFYETKRSFSPFLLSVQEYDSTELKLTFISDTDSSFDVELQTEAYDFSGKRRRRLDNVLIYHVIKGNPLVIDYPKGFITQYDFEDCYWVFRVKRKNETLAQTVYLFLPPKDLNFHKPIITWKLVNSNKLELISNKFAYGVFIDVPDGIELSDNYFHLLPGEKKIIQLNGKINSELLKKQLKIKSLIDTY
jgi:beta-mannosidase